MDTIHASWKVRKSRIKAAHFKDFETNEERIDNRPDDILLESFQILLDYWNDDTVKVILLTQALNIFLVIYIFNFSDMKILSNFSCFLQKRAVQNSISRSKYTDTHTAGPRSFAQIRNKMVCRVLIYEFKTCNFWIAPIMFTTSSKIAYD